MAIKHWHESEQPREKLIQRGAEALSDAELLAIFLGAGLHGGNAVTLGQSLLVQAGGLRQLLDATPQELQRYKGLGLARAAMLKAALEAGKRYLEQHYVREQPLREPCDVGPMLMARLRGHPCEVFAALFLDNRHRVLAYEELFRGTINAAVVHPREVVRRALAHNAAAIIFAHNHPSGDPEPSSADRCLTRELARVLEVIDVRVLDHLVIGDNSWVSMAHRKMF
ncbi:RadC family protein [Alcanivorax quisquiliarum]|uniref:DNA repair protein RadC n=1 Tax=Alcanivorax quisquiliarum TaxID=2933565 RepID=A0ABT0E574_9GAMM|nr:DNA repair protein RadC [Alcanivorax quisquiliarum]MCK0536977.1 DNA repair protein RadC [Alcanivorax quisquiliarum]